MIECQFQMTTALRFAPLNQAASLHSSSAHSQAQPAAGQPTMRLHDEEASEHSIPNPNTLEKATRLAEVFPRNFCETA